MVCLSDFGGAAGGATAYVPFSHMVGASPGALGVDLMRPPDGLEVVGVAAPKGSLLVWTDKTWHGAFPRRPEAPARVDLLLFHCHASVLPEEAYAGTVSDALLRRHGAVFARLMGLRTFNGWGAEGPTARLAARRSRLERLGVAG
jgi:ectoine hydroxylase-related dioxygenase (phytanoyl-CoA dioxygenase family)